MKLKRYAQTTKYAGLAAVAALSVANSLQAKNTSPPVTASKWTVSTGASTISAPAHGTPVFSGKVAGVSGDVVTVDGSLSSGALNKVDLSGGGGPFAYQYVLTVRHDYDVKTNIAQTLDLGDSPGTQGDWWTVETNGTANVLLTSDGFGSTGSRIEAGDIVEIFKLINLKQLFGSGASLKITAESTFDDTSGDQVYTMLGVGYANTVTYHDGSLAAQGWWLDFGTFLGDGANFTFAPDQAIRVLRNVGGNFDVTVTGVLQAYNLSHYLVTGANPLSTGYAAPAPIGATRLLESGFPQEPNFDDTTDAVFTPFVGVGTAHTLVFHDGSLATKGWWLDFGSVDATFPLDPGTGLQINTTTSDFVWRQSLPWIP